MPSTNLIRQSSGGKYMRPATEQEIRDVLQTVEDPELPVNILDLGMVEAVSLVPTGEVQVQLIPTFVGCPALEIIRSRILARLQEHGVQDATVTWNLTTPWEPSRISVAGRSQLAAYGITAGDDITAAAAPRGALCPHCLSSNTERTSSFGTALCRVGYYCHDCRNSFEGMKRPGTCTFNRIVQRDVLRRIHGTAR